MTIHMRAAGLCPWCKEKADTELLLLCAGQLRCDLPICGHCGAAVALDDWSITITRNGKTYRVDGHDVSEDLDTVPW